MVKSKTKGSVAKFNDSGKVDYAPYLGFGSLSVIYGISIFVLLPIALLQSNVGLMLTIFFLILVGMIFGLSLLASNIQPVLETLFVKLLLCWESVSMKQLILKNFIVHRSNNKLTSIIYSLTVGSVIFLFVALALQLEVLTRTQNVYGEVDLLVTETSSSHKIYPANVDLILRANSNCIESWAYSSKLNEANSTYLSHVP